MTGQSRTVHDPFLGKDVQVSSRLTDRLRGRYATGPTLPNGEPEFGWREFPTPAIQKEAADEIDRLLAYQNETALAWTKLTESQEEEIAQLQEKVEILEAEIRVMKQLPNVLR